MELNGRPDVLVRVIDDDDQMRRSWKFALQAEGLTVKTYTGAVQFLRDDDPSIPGCIVCDVRMPEMTGLELQVELKSRHSILPLIFVSAHGDIVMAVKAVKDGAYDFLPKPVQVDRLIEVVTGALEKNRHDVREKQTRDQACTAYSQLSAREKEVVQGVADGLLNKQIAFNLGITEKTVISHRASLRRKLGMRTASEMTRLLMLVNGEVSGIEPREEAH